MESSYTYTHGVQVASEEPNIIISNTCNTPIPMLFAGRGSAPKLIINSTLAVIRATVRCCIICCAKLIVSKPRLMTHVAANKLNELCFEGYWWAAFGE